MSSKEANLIRETCTPALFAKTISAGKWVLAAHLLLLDRKLIETINKPDGRLIVQMPPRHGKSELVSRYFPAWYLGTFPDRQVMLASYEAHQAAKYGRYARNLIDEHGQKVFGVRVADDSSAADRWGIAGREGGMVTAGVGGPLTGKGAHVLIVDDPVKNAEQAVSEVYRDKAWEWWQSTAFTRLEPGGATIIVQTRWHNDDLAGKVQQEQQEEGWDVVSLPAIAEEDDLLGRRPGEPLWPERYPLERLEKIRAGQSPYWWNSLFQQRPSQHESVEWPAEYFDDRIWFDEWPRDHVIIKTMALDPSKGKSDKKGDYSAFAMLMVDRNFNMWIDCDMDRRPPEKIVTDGVELYRNFGPDRFGIESNAWQELLGKDFTRVFLDRGMPWVEPLQIENRVNKIVRIRDLGQFLRDRRLRVKRNAGGRILVQQLREFPLAKHDDGPDAVEMAVRLAEQAIGGPQVTEDEFLPMGY